MFRIKVILIRFHFNGHTHWDFIHKLKELEPPCAA